MQRSLAERIAPGKLTTLRNQTLIGVMRYRPRYFTNSSKGKGRDTR
jgi:hypothetical protein